jgi:hypothetical protein
MSGFIAGAETPVVFYAIQSGKLWPFVLLFGTLISGIIVIVFVVPLYLGLVYRNKLTLVRAILIGGLFLTGAYLIFLSLNLINGGFSVIRINGKNLIWNERIYIRGFNRVLFYYTNGNVRFGHI